MVVVDIEDLLANWAAWARDRPTAHHCASLEHHYRPPQHWHPPQPSVFVNVLSALDVDRALRVVPLQHRRALILHYHSRAPSRYICRVLALRAAAWDQFFSDAKLMLRNILRFQEFARISRVTTRPQPSAETTAPEGAG